MSDKAELVEINQEESQMVSMIERMAVNPEVDVEKLERLMVMQEKMLDRSAEQEYTRSMVAVQQEIQAVTRDKVNPQTHSRFVSLEAIKKVVTPVYTSHGFALSYGEGESTKQDNVRVTCKVMHAGGHSESFFYDCPIDDKGIAGKTNKTPTHGKASAVTYGERYILKLIFNITIQDEDDDGNAASQTVEYITEEMVNILHAKIIENEIDEKKFNSWLKRDLKVDSLEDVSMQAYKTVDARINSAIRAKGKK
jgi:hypothetical protein